MSGVATIVPLKHLWAIIDNSYFMALAHCAEDPDYLKFFRNRSEEGKYVIIDNSTVELGAPVEFEGYLETATKMKARAILLPDWLRDTEKTLAGAEAALGLLRNHPTLKGCFDIMIAPQGITQWSWITNAIELVDLVEKSGLARKVLVGISCRYTDFFGPAFRADAAYKLLTYYMPSKDIQIHFLGCYMDPSREIGKTFKMKKIKGIDSSYPSVFARHHLELNPESFKMPRPPRTIDFLKDQYDEALLAKDIRAWRKACLGNN